MGENVIKSEEYSFLKDFKLKIEGKEGFALCFWVYLLKFATFPATLVSQVNIGGTAPFLVLNDKKILMLFPLISSHDGAPEHGNPTSFTEFHHASMNSECPLENRIHVGCKLHIDGEIVAEQPLSSSLSKDSMSNSLKKITLVGNDLQGYVHNATIFPLNFSVNDHYAKDLPLQLSIDTPSASEIEEDSAGVPSIVGGKSSCRRIFSLDVVLLNAFGQPVNKEMEINDGEAPLFMSYDGIEFASYDRPGKILHGHASFKLKISQAPSHPIHCISRNCTGRACSVICKKTSAAIHPLGGSQSCGFDDGSVEIQHITVRDAKPSPLSKRVRLEQEKISAMEQPDGECNSHPWTSNMAENAFAKGLDGRLENLEEADNSPSDSESTGARNLSFKSKENSVSGLTIFKYCLGILTERYQLLKEIATSFSDEEILEFAHQVSIYSGCSHHRYQIITAKRLMEEGRNAWNMILQNNDHVHWNSAFFEIEEHFMKISCCSTRSLTQQDFELLRIVTGCRDYVAQENFEKLWCWLYPVAFTLSRDWINTTWKSTSPKWIEGFLTKEEAECSLQGPRGVQDPGTFVLQFPTSRSWPHPDAGIVIVTYVGSDYTLGHWQVSVDYIYRIIRTR